MTHRRSSETGAALLSVLLVVSILSAVAIAMTDASLRALARATAADARAKVSWQITGAEEVGLVAVQDLITTTEGALVLENPVLRTPIEFAANGGRISGELVEATNCFNLNALATAGDDEDNPSDARLAYADLLLALEFSEFEVEALSDALIDWLDSDQSPRISGAEDGYYVNQRPPYRASGQPFVELSELRAVLGYTPEVIERLLPNICARTSGEVGIFNLNTLDERHAPLMAVMLGGIVNLQDARDIITTRPFGGWQSIEAFQAMDAVQNVPQEFQRTNLFGLRSTYLKFQGTAHFQDVSGDFSTLFELGDSQTVQIVRRDRGAR